MSRGRFYQLSQEFEKKFCKIGFYFSLSESDSKIKYNSRGRNIDLDEGQITNLYENISHKNWSAMYN